MREALFIKQNLEKWQAFENEPSHDPDILAQQFITITDDLAYSKTFYPKSKTTQYLNGLASGFHQSIYKNKKENKSRFIKFWKTELPLLFAQYRNQLLYSFIVFVLFGFMGALSAKYDNNFVRLIMGDGYVNMTNENIAKGDPFGVYKSEDPVLMFIHIAENNLYVTVICFAAGFFFSIGSLYFSMRNAVMLGSFEYFFVSKGLGMQSVLVIWIHGTLEISSIIIACGAGLVLGNSLIFPKTYNRLESLKKGAADGMKITIGILPVIVVAAIFESFVTRHTEMPLWLSISILLSSLSFIIWYVVIYPGLLQRKLNLPLSNNESEH
ncbi:MAG TPA: stage II sporulation protein M [Mucilaginibacter sp.]|nr:stage II sporulation protein M [Mucilaginibacter sp.]